MTEILDDFPHPRASQWTKLPWRVFFVQYDEDFPANDVLTWMTASYEVWFHDPLHLMEAQLGNKDFASEIDFASKCIFSKEGKCQLTYLMSENWAWSQAVQSHFISNYIAIWFVLLKSHCRRWSNRWSNVCASSHWEQWNYGFSCNWSQWILPTLCISWKCSEPCQVSPS